MTEEYDNQAPQEEPREEVNFEPEEELGDLGVVQAKLKKLKDELTQVKKEKQEYLDGWQRCKADSINAKREAVMSSVRAAEMLREELVHDVIPVLDSFDVAAGSEQWANLDAGWRGGMENVRSQLLDALERHGVKRFGKVGDIFDSQLHDVVQEVDDVAGEPHSIIRILRYGYRSGDRVLRPAQVVTKK
ncbi:MAG: Protein GrpE [Candidatus Kaiserbacteria bacterium GW2011_GWC2_52_8b]|uniref:Protein GrpE n=2 Tax=Candidatus Kaiseribacteriota TaxID=1752734 RepID=A0A0G1XFQ6_9BACT|nr:MAG: Protein GrpE [Candidatus Kaiserbacteria bacterium GW2011_GWA2_52_12]KKW29745.1 MAG: Protein GrpE [Candidatus Kaiserbacteria bacterium GW2011_GWC2_52_8b]